MSSTGETQERHWLVTSPRTASNMLVKILNLPAQNVRPAFHGGYFFLPTIPARYPLQPKPATQWTPDEKQRLWELEQSCFDNLQDYLEKAGAEGQGVFVKEHAMLVNHPLIESEFIHGKGSAGGDAPTPLVQRGAEEGGTRSRFNKTVVSDEFLKTWKPTFLIRHPALIFTSLFRMYRREGFQSLGGEPNAIELTLQWNRALFDFYEAHFGEGSRWPVVLDADDVMLHPAVVEKYAGIAGLDPAKLLFSWEKVSEEELGKIPDMERDAQVSLYGSERVDLGKVGGEIDIGVEAGKWRVEFGEETGKRLEGLVRACMDDYEYMRSKKLTVE